MSALPRSPANPPAALAAFLRGVERRGAILAELQCGDASRGDAALAATMGGFPDLAAGQPMTDWPRLFWGRLLAQPQLRQRVAVALALQATDSLAQLGSGPRAALLLRLAAGLDEVQAAAVLGVAPATYGLALRRGLPSQDDGRADLQAWQRLREQIHHRIKTLPDARLLRLSRAREAALRGLPAPAAAPTTPQPTRRAQRRWLLPTLWTLLALCALAFAASWWWPGIAGRAWPGDSGTAWVRLRELPPADAPASRFGRQAGLIAHGDFALLTDPMALSSTNDLDFYSWLAAQQLTAASDGALPAADPQTALPDASAVEPGTGTKTGTFNAPR